MILMHSVIRAEWRWAVRDWCDRSPRTFPSPAEPTLHPLPPERETRLLRASRPSAASNTRAERLFVSISRRFLVNSAWSAWHIQPNRFRTNQCELPKDRRASRKLDFSVYTAFDCSICTYLNFSDFNLYTSPLSTSTMAFWTRRRERKLPNAERVFLALTLIAEGKNARTHPSASVQICYKVQHVCSSCVDRKLHICINSLDVDVHETINQREV